LPVDTRFAYAYAIGRIRVIEKKLLDKGKLDRMIDSKSPDEALKVIVESGYVESSTLAGNAGEYENLLREEEKRLYGLLREVTSDDELFNIFLLKNDYHNIKVLLKSEFLAIEANDNLLVSGTMPPMHIKTAINERELDRLPLYMKEAIDECLDTFSRTNDPRQIDLILDKAYFRHIVEISEKSGHEYVKELVKIIIDLTNIKTFIRIKNLNMSADLLSRSLIPGGTIADSFFTENMDTNMEVFVEKIKNSPYFNICSQGISNYVNTGNLSRLEKLADDYIINFVKKSRYKTLGIEPLIGYLVAKENEIKNVRIIMVGKINNISGDIIRERLRDTYV